VDLERIRKVNHDLLGPLFYRYLFKLYLTQIAYDSNDTVILFLARGGLRLRAFYEKFLKVNNLESHIPYSDFYVSRMALVKASMISHYEIAIRDFLKEYGWHSIGETVSCFFGQDVYSQWTKKPGAQNPTIPINQDSCNQLFWSHTESADYLRQLLREQQEFYLEYRNEILGRKKNVLVIDTGWSGSILNYMQILDEEREYTAQYFGRYNYGQGELPWFNKVIGVEVEGQKFDRKKPVTAVFLNRHLIEGICEIKWPSVTGYQKLDKKSLGPIGGGAPESLIAPVREEVQAYGVAIYICAAKDGLNIEAIHSSGERASRQLCSRLMYPSKCDLVCFSVGSRSADFGKNLDVPVFLSPIRNVFKMSIKLNNIKNSLWPLGQMTLEFPKTHHFLQFVYHGRWYRLLGLLRWLKTN